MAGDGVYMNVPAVRKLGTNFAAISKVLRGVSRTLQTLTNLLRSTAFVGLVGGIAVERYISMIKPQIDRLQKDCDEMSKDLKAAADAYERGDAQGALRFY